jgi:hypothetical protein
MQVTLSLPWKVPLKYRMKEEVKRKRAALFERTLSKLIAKNAEEYMMYYVKVKSFKDFNVRGRNN